MGCRKLQHWSLICIGGIADGLIAANILYANGIRDIHPIAGVLLLFSPIDFLNGNRIFAKTLNLKDVVAGKVE